MGRPIKDEEILGWILDGRLVIEHVTSAHPQLWFRGRHRKPILNEQGGKGRIFGGKRYRWRIRFEGRTRGIVCSKLVWMYVHRAVVPEGCQIHHGLFGPHYDGYFNLTCLTIEEHHALHYGPVQVPENF